MLVVAFPAGKGASMNQRRLVCAIILTFATLLGSGVTAQNPTSSQRDATTVTPGSAESASIASTSYDGAKRVSITVYRLEDTPSAKPLHEILSFSGHEAESAVTEREMSSLQVGEESIAYVIRPDLSSPDGPQAVDFTRVAEYVFVLRTGGDDPVALLESATGYLPYDPVDELDDAGTDDLDLLIPSPQEMPMGYVVIPEDAETVG